MATTWVALLRAVNLGPRNRVAMADLRALLEELGHRDVRTLLQSGNAVFSGGRPTAAKLRAAILERTGTDAPVVLLEAAELQTVVDENPFGDLDDPKQPLVQVLADPRDAARVQALQERDWGTERLAVGSRAAYVHLPDGIRNAKLPPAVERAAQDTVTGRNWATVTKLLALAGGPAAR
ncbi:DUF1697 domain-containing protein [Conexibacter sp. SYSU D00693]|uniref:DUF1697 domain-containing protein n=1 Tax=Conexibacter sp. SYSU D00693 TaxID=2812560 RepID=UPI00196A69A5|nr:DUF1697 domain-containing protein [Conexibacter sp. SYSU D00693]